MMTYRNGRSVFLLLLLVVTFTLWTVVTSAKVQVKKDPTNPVRAVDKEAKVLSEGKEGESLGEGKELVQVVKDTEGIDEDDNELSDEGAKVVTTPMPRMAGLETDADDPQGIVHTYDQLKAMAPSPGVQDRKRMPVHYPPAANHEVKRSVTSVRADANSEEMKSAGVKQSREQRFVRSVPQTPGHFGQGPEKLTSIRMSQESKPHPKLHTALLQLDHQLNDMKTKLAAERIVDGRYFRENKRPKLPPPSRLNAYANDAADGPYNSVTGDVVDEGVDDGDDDEDDYDDNDYEFAYGKTHIKPLPSKAKDAMDDKYAPILHTKATNKYRKGDGSPKYATPRKISGKPKHAKKKKGSKKAKHKKSRKETERPKHVKYRDIDEQPKHARRIKRDTEILKIHEHKDNDGDTEGMSRRSAEQTTVIHSSKSKLLQKGLNQSHTSRLSEQVMTDFNSTTDTNETTQGNDTDTNNMPIQYEKSPGPKETEAKSKTNFEKTLSTATTQHNDKALGKSLPSRDEHHKTISDLLFLLKHKLSPHYEEHVARTFKTHLKSSIKDLISQVRHILASIDDKPHQQNQPPGTFAKPGLVKNRASKGKSDKNHLARGFAIPEPKIRLVRSPRFGRMPTTGRTHGFVPGGYNVVDSSGRLERVPTPKIYSVGIISTERDDNEMDDRDDGIGENEMEREIDEAQSHYKVAHPENVAKAIGQRVNLGEEHFSIDHKNIRTHKKRRNHATTVGSVDCHAKLEKLTNGFEHFYSRSMEVLKHLFQDKKCQHHAHEHAKDLMNKGDKLGKMAKELLQEARQNHFTKSRSDQIKAKSTSVKAHMKQDKNETKSHENKKIHISQHHDKHKPKKHEDKNISNGHHKEIAKKNAKIRDQILSRFHHDRSHALRVTSDKPKDEEENEKDSNYLDKPPLRQPDHGARIRVKRRNNRMRRKRKKMKSAKKLPMRKAAAKSSGVRVPPPKDPFTAEEKRKKVRFMSMLKMLPSSPAEKNVDAKVALEKSVKKTEADIGKAVLAMDDKDDNLFIYPGSVDDVLMKNDIVKREIKKDSLDSEANKLQKAGLSDSSKGRKRRVQSNVISDILAKTIHLLLNPRSLGNEKLDSANDTDEKYTTYLQDPKLSETPREKKPYKSQNSPLTERKNPRLPTDFDHPGHGNAHRRKRRSIAEDRFRMAQSNMEMKLLDDNEEIKRRLRHLKRLTAMQNMQKDTSQLFEDQHTDTPPPRPFPGYDSRTDDPRVKYLTKLDRDVHTEMMKLDYEKKQHTDDGDIAYNLGLDKPNEFGETHQNAYLPEDGNDLSSIDREIERSKRSVGSIPNKRPHDEGHVVSNLTGDSETLNTTHIDGDIQVETNSTVDKIHRLSNTSTQQRNHSSVISLKSNATSQKKSPSQGKPPLGGYGIKLKRRKRLTLHEAKLERRKHVAMQNLQRIKMYEQQMMSHVQYLNMLSEPRWKEIKLHPSDQPSPILKLRNYFPEPPDDTEVGGDEEGQPVQYTRKTIYPANINHPSSWIAPHFLKKRSVPQHHENESRSLSHGVEGRPIDSIIHNAVHPHTDSDHSAVLAHKVVKRSASIPKLRDYFPEPPDDSEAGRDEEGQPVRYSRKTIYPTKIAYPSSWIAPHILKKRSVPQDHENESRSLSHGVEELPVDSIIHNDIHPHTPSNHSAVLAHKVVKRKASKPKVRGDNEYDYPFDDRSNDNDESVEKEHRPPASDVDDYTDDDGSDREDKGDEEDDGEGKYGPDDDNDINDEDDENEDDDDDDDDDEDNDDEDEKDDENRGGGIDVEENGHKARQEDEVAYTVKDYHKKFRIRGAHGVRAV